MSLIPVSQTALSFLYILFFFLFIFFSLALHVPVCLPLILHRRKNMQNARAQRKPRATDTRTPGLPAALLAHLQAQGVKTEEARAMDMEEALRRAERLDVPTLHKTFQTVLKITRDVETMRQRLELLVGPQPEEIAPLVSVLNSALRACQLQELPADTEQNSEAFLEHIMAAGVEAEQKTLKMAVQFVLAHTWVEGAVAHCIGRKVLDKVLCRHITAEDGADGLFAALGISPEAREKQRTDNSRQLELLAQIVSHAGGEVCLWDDVLSLYTEVGKHTLPEEHARALGAAVIRTYTSPDALTSAVKQYIRTMKKRLCDFGLVRPLVSRLLAVQTEETSKALQRLLIFALTDKRADSRAFTDVGFNSVPVDIFMTALQQVHADRLNTHAALPVLKQFIRKHRDETERMQEISEYLRGVRKIQTQSGRSVDGLLAALNTHMGRPRRKKTAQADSAPAAATETCNETAVQEKCTE